jgi:hypothetical protein
VALSLTLLPVEGVGSGRSVSVELSSVDAEEGKRGEQVSNAWIHSTKRWSGKERTTCAGRRARQDREVRE